MLHRSINNCLWFQWASTKVRASIQVTIIKMPDHPRTKLLAVTAMIRATLVFALAGAAFSAQAAPVESVDARLISTCEARTDARMESMTLGKLEQIRNYEFSLRMAMAQLAGGSDAMSPSDWQQATSQLRQARLQLAQVCGVSVPAQG